MINTIADLFIPHPNLTIICSCYFWSHFTPLSWLHGFHYFGSQKTCYHKRAVSHQQENYSRALSFSKAKGVTDKSVHRFSMQWARIKEGAESFFTCRILMTINNINIHYFFMTYQRAGEIFALRKLHWCNTSYAKALKFI